MAQETATQPLAGNSPMFDHPVRILFLYGSLRERSYSRLLAEEAARIITEMGAEIRFYDPRELPIYGSVAADHPKVQELRALQQFSSERAILIGLNGEGDGKTIFSGSAPTDFSCLLQ